MKYASGVIYDTVSTSLPVRGAWIEMPAGTGAAIVTAASLPVRGAWIEITPHAL